MDPESGRPSYLVIGHVTYDVLPDRTSIGGTATFAGAMARNLGYDVRILTAADETFPFTEPTLGVCREWARTRETSTDAVSVTCVPSTDATTFEYSWPDTGRVQLLTRVASTLGVHDVPAPWLQSDIWHLAPVAHEIDLGVISVIPSRSFVGVTPQGWFRSVDATSIVQPCDWEASEAVLDRAQAIVLSRDDTPSAYELATSWSRAGVVAVVTEAMEGATVFADGERMHVPALPANQVDELGAGDVFAVSFFARLARGDAPKEAALFASAAASLSVARHGSNDAPTLDDIRRALDRFAQRL